jgi:hypothetical protein
LPSNITQFFGEKRHRENNTAKCDETNVVGAQSWGFPIQPEDGLREGFLDCALCLLHCPWTQIFLGTVFRRLFSVTLSIDSESATNVPLVHSPVDVAG